MKALTIWTSSVVLLAMVACSNGSSTSGTSSSVTTTLKNRYYKLAGQLNGIEYALQSTALLDNPAANSKEGWVVLSFDALEVGKADLALTMSGARQDGISLSLNDGKGAIVIDPSHKIMKTGNVSGKRSYVCGPQGMRCQEELPELKKSDLTYPCGPQGRVCQIELPGLPSAASAADDADARNAAYGCGADDICR